MATSRVSIGLPVYNGEPYLAEAIESVLAQTFTDFELVVTDNASTDATEEICRSYAGRDPRVRYSRNDRNLGGAPNFNRCYALADESEYFKWIAHDDIIAPTYLERCVAALDGDRRAALAFPRISYMDAAGSVIDAQREPDLSLLQEDAGDRCRALVRHGLAREDIFWAIFGLMRRAAIDRTELLGSFVASDQVMLFQLLLEGSFIQVPETLYRRRVHAEASMSKHKTPRERAAWFDTSARPRVVLPHWTLLGRHLRSVHRASLGGAATKARCYQAVGHRVLSEWRGLGGDVKLALADVLANGSRS